MPRSQHVSTSRRALPSIATLLAAAISLVGCKTDQMQSQVAAANDANINRVNNLYSAFRARTMGTPPRDEQSLKAFIKKDMGPKKLQMMQIDPNNTDAVFVSERDGKPFKIKWGVAGANPPAPVVFELEGIGGKKLVAFSDSTVKEVETAEADKLWEAKASSKPPPMGGPTPDTADPAAAAPSK